MNKAEFVNMIECGDDIMFTVGEQGFTIITWPDDGPIVGNGINREQRSSLKHRQRW